MNTETTKDNTTDAVVVLASEFIRHHPVTIAELPALLSTLRDGLSGVIESGVVQSVQERVERMQPPKAARRARKPAVPVEESITPGYIVCLEDGKTFRTLTRHLRTAFNLTPDEYRRRWGLPADYPMAAPEFSKLRSELAKRSGLGRTRPSND